METIVTPLPAGVEPVPGEVTRPQTTTEPLSAGGPADNEWERENGSPYPLGVTWIAAQQAYNFALYSKHATKVELLFYKEQDPVNPVFTCSFDVFRNKSGRVWHARIPLQEMPEARYYAYRIDGPARPQPGERFGFDFHDFDREKIILDPFATAVYFPPNLDRGAACRPGPNDGKAPLGYLCPGDDDFDWGDDRPVQRAGDLVIYEMHVRQFTRNPNSGLPPEQRGTYEGVTARIPYLKDLGVTAVELMPVHQNDPQEGSYWGYMPLNFFAPQHNYAVDSRDGRQRDEFRAMVRAFHEADIEVLVDVVYNHTTEGNHLGPKYSLRGIDSSSYYMMNRDNHAYPYREDNTYCGNTLLVSNASVRHMIVDSMRYWVEQMHVDGFRFDLALVLAQNQDASANPDAPLFDQIAADRVLNQVRMIAELWNMERAKFPGRVWGQWNGRYRDCLRRFVKGDGGLVGELMSNIYGSADLFPDDIIHSFHPWQSINYVACHDGLTLGDLVSFTDNSSEYNQHSWGCGHEGLLNVPSNVVELRKRQVKNFCTLLMVSNGTPMIRMGDEFMQTQQGDKNPYNVDSEKTWLDWDLTTRNSDILRFFKEMIAFRKRHKSISRPTFWRTDVAWYGVDGGPDLSESSRSLAFCLHGGSVGDKDIYVLINAWWEALSFRIQEGSPGQWRRVVDTSKPANNDIVDENQAPIVNSTTYQVPGRSVVVLVR